jgi:hypothetical protein
MMDARRIAALILLLEMLTMSPSDIMFFDTSDARASL